MNQIVLLAAVVILGGSSVAASDRSELSCQPGFPYSSGLFSRFLSPHLPSLFSVTVSEKEGEVLIVTGTDVSPQRAHPSVFIDSRQGKRETLGPESRIIGGFHGRGGMRSLSAVLHGSLCLNLIIASCHSPPPPSPSRNACFSSRLK